MCSTDLEAAQRQQVAGGAGAVGAVRYGHDLPVLRDVLQVFLEVGVLDAQEHGERALGRQFVRTAHVEHEHLARLEQQRVDVGAGELLRLVRPGLACCGSRSCGSRSCGSRSCDSRRGGLLCERGRAGEDQGGGDGGLEDVHGASLSLLSLLFGRGGGRGGCRTVFIFANTVPVDPPRICGYYAATGCWL
ncbi:MAG: hypothetical protein JF619_25000, partial [Massilia sp.]|nr:hypothetical protein [Massilia sp.]